MVRSGATKRRRSERADLIERTRESLEFDRVLAFFQQKAQTKPGKTLIQESGMLPPARLRAHFGLLANWLELLKNRAPLYFPEIPNPTFFERNPRLDPFGAEGLRTLRDLLKFWRTCERDDSLAFTRQTPWNPPDIAALTERLDNLFESDGAWREDISPAYGRLIREWSQTEVQLERCMQEMLRRYASVLSESLIYERNHRKVLAVKLDFKGRVKGILQDYSASGKTAYIEPEAAVQLHNQLAQIQTEIKEELWRIRCEVSVQVLEEPRIADMICPMLAQMDAMQALALVAKDTGCQCICPNEEGRLELYDARHPFLDEAFAAYRAREAETDQKDRNRMVPFTLRLGDEPRGLVISGANTGGKTVTLKTTGLIAIMANSGLPVPTGESSLVPYYEHILADIGDQQSLSHNLSTYASHLANLNRILSVEHTTALVLLDELGSGTDPMEGNALSQAVIEELVARRFHLLVTTHQQVLCTLALNNPYLENGSMIFDPRMLRPTYRFTQGVPGRSHALDIARNAGLPEAILLRAHQLTDDQQVDIQNAIRQLQEQHREYARQKSKLRKEELRLHRRIQDARQEQSRLQALQKEIEQNEKQRVTRVADKVERDLRQKMASLTDQREKRQLLKGFNQAKREALKPYEQELVPKIEFETSGLEPGAWNVGDEVYLLTWRQKGKLLAIDKDQVRIDCNGKVLQTPLDGVIHLTQPKQEKPVHVSDVFEGGGADHTLMEIKLLGLSADEALLEVDQAIDRALSRGVPFLKIIHGHGKGILKTAVRDYLKRHPAKAGWQTNIDTQHDGITELSFLG